MSDVSTAILGDVSVMNFKNLGGKGRAGSLAGEPISIARGLGASLFSIWRVCGNVLIHMTVPNDLKRL